MRFLKRQTLNRRVPNDDRMYVDINNGVVMGTDFALTLPKGTETDRPDSVLRTEGMIRYNTTSGNVEVRQGNSWRQLRYKEATGVSIGNLGPGDASERYFGPLSTDYVNSTFDSSVTWDLTQMALNIVVLVGNVFQVPNLNYVIVQSSSGSPLSGDNAPYADGYYLDFGGSPIDVPPVGSNVYVLYGFDR